jgi:poly(3-hydroxybutyrate) depolymerase
MKLSSTAISFLITILLCTSGFIFAESMDPIYSQEPKNVPPLQRDSIEFEGLVRSYAYYVPENLQSNASLVFVFHGAGGDARRIRLISGYEWERVANENNLIVVYPEGYEKNWNGCRRSSPYSANKQNINDLGFIQALVNHFQSHYSIKPTQTFAAGLSNGGHLVYRFALESPETFQALASMAANLPSKEDLECRSAERGVSIMIMTGTEDPMNRFDGGDVIAPDGTNLGSVRSAKNTVEFFRKLAGYDAVPSVYPYPDKDDLKSTGVDRLTWDSNSGPEVSLYLVYGGGHSIPQSKFRAPEVYGRTITEISGPEEIWKFFQRQIPAQSVEISGKQNAPLLTGLGELHHPVSTKNKMAQRFFDQGLTLSYAFNHKESERSFREAARLDPNLAMAYWGIALVLGPNYNLSMDKDAAPAAYKSIQKALALSEKATAKEKAFIQALSLRYTEDGGQDRTQYDKAYASAMRNVAKTFADDPDANALFAESLMDLHPWDLWTREGEPKEWTPEILRILEDGIKRWPDHPGFHHFYIHAVEASNHPESAIVSAEVLPKLVPGAGHLVHMPSHIYIRVGRYLDAVKANEDAIKVDDAYITQCRHQGIYPLGYAPHNHHFLVASAMLAGKGSKALAASRELARRQDPKMMEVPALGPVIQHFWITPLHVMIRFGKWDEILKEPHPEKNLMYPTGVWHYARGLANLRTGNMNEAKEHLKQLRSFIENPVMKKMKIMEINLAADILAIAGEVLTGEIAAKEGDFKKAILHLQKGVELEDGLMYQEPADWHASVRQNLGSVLIQAGFPADAEKVFRKDLEYVPQNGWSLFGLAQALRAQGKDEEAKQIAERFQIAWSEADTSLIAARF